MTIVVISLVGVNREDQKPVAMIKAVRTITGWGLKDAKQFVDGVRDKGEGTLSVEVGNKEAFHNQISTLRSAGAIVSTTGHYEMYIDQFKEIAVAATLKGDFFVAKKINEFLEHNFG